MTDEEKKAIEWLKKADWFSARLYSPTILNLIEKQQKEIDNNYISKDKIKARIEELKEYSYKGNIKDDFLMIRIKAKIQELQKFLENEK